MTARECTKKRDARAKLLFCQSKPIDFFAVLDAVAVVVAWAPYNATAADNISFKGNTDHQV